MTNSFQPQAQPVDTYVQTQSTDLDVLARALKAVNPGIEAFLDNKMDEAIEDEQQKGREIAYDELLDDGSVKKAVDKVRKKDGNEAARQLIGGSIFSQKAYERTRTKILASKFENTFDADYLNAQIDTGKVDSEGQPILYSLRELPHNSEHVQAWRQERANNYLSQLEGISPKIVNDHFMPTMQDNFFKFTSKHSKDHREFQFENLQLEIPSIVREASDYIFKGNIEEAKTKINDHLDLLRNAGVTGAESKQVYKDLLDNIIAIAEINRSSGNPVRIKKARSLPTKLAKIISYGPGGSKNLLDHPDFAERFSNFEESFSSTIVNEIKARDQLEALAKQQNLNEAMIQISNIKTTNDNGDIIPEKVKEQQDLYNDFLNDPANVDIYQDVQKIGMMDNQRLKTEIAPSLRRAIMEGFYGDDIGKALNDIRMAQSQHPTLDAEAIEIFQQLETLARTVPKLGTQLQTSVDNIMKPTEIFLGKGLNGYLKAENAKKGIKLRRTTAIEFEEWLTDYIETNKQFPSRQVIQDKEKQYRDQLLAEQGILETEEVDSDYPIGIADNPYRNYSGKKEFNTGETKSNTASSFMETGTTQGSTPIDAKIKNQKKEKTKNVTTKEVENKTQDTKENKSILNSLIGNYYNPQIINPSTLENMLESKFITPSQGGRFIDKAGNYYQLEKGSLMPGVMQDINITKPIAQPNLEKLAIEGGFTPEQAKIMAAIAMAESGGVARALNDVGDDNSFGLWQINMIDVPDYKLGEERRAKLKLKTNDELYNPATNVRAAKMIFDEQGFEAWGAYTNGDYKDFLTKTD